MMNKKTLETKIFLECFDTKDMKLIFKTAILVLWLVLSENSRMNNGRIVKEHSNEIIREINIMKPKSIIGFMSVIIKDPKATIVVKVV